MLSRARKKPATGSGWPDLKPEDTPSASNYLRTHSAGEILERIGKGLSRVNSSMRKSYGYHGILWAYTLFAAALLYWKRHLVWRIFRRRPMLVLAVLAYFSGYFLLVAWYTRSSTATVLSSAFSSHGSSPWPWSRSPWPAV